MSIAIFQERPQTFHPAIEVSGCFIWVDDKFLLLNRANGEGWGIPSGKLDEGESKEAAVLREVAEETAITLDNAEFLNTLYVRRPDIDFIFHLFIQKCEERPIVTLNTEHTDFRFCTLDEAFEMPLMIGAAEVIQTALSVSL